MNASIALRSPAGRSQSARRRRGNSTASDPDAHLLVRVQQRDVQALELLYDRYASRALGLALHILRDRDLAEQVLQDAFWRVWRSADRYEPARGRFSTWLFTIVHNLAVDQLRRRHEVLPLDDPQQAETIERDTGSTGSDVAELAAGHLHSQEIRAALKSLPDQQRRVIELAYFEELTRPEIAQRLSVPLGTVHTRVRLGLEKLRRILDRERE